MTRRVRLAVIASTGVLTLSCSASGEGPTAGGSRDRPANPLAEAPVQERSATAASDRPEVANEALGPSRRRVSSAIVDLKHVALWRLLTSDLYSLQLQTDPGLHGIPDDGHLADAMIGAVVEPGGSGTHCSIRFYPAAIDRELATLEEGHRAGVFGPPPTKRQLWAAVLAHELAHCRKWGGGEAYAQRWEKRTLKVVVRERLE